MLWHPSTVYWLILPSIASSTYPDRRYIERFFLPERRYSMAGYFGPMSVRDEGRIISIERIVIPLSREQVNWMMTEEDTIDVRSEICGRRYPFSREELADLMEERL